MLTAGQVGSPLSGIDAGSGDIQAVAFSANGEYLVSGDEEMVRVWRVEDGKQMASMKLRFVTCLAVSKDGRWIAAGTAWCEVRVWDARTYETFFQSGEDGGINGVDFSPDSTRLLVASRNCRAIVWDIATRKLVVGPLRHERAVRAAKFSPQGDRIATATLESVRVYDGNDGRLLVDIPATLAVTPWFNTSLLWSKAHLFVISDTKIKHIEASTGSSVSEWPVSESNEFSWIALPQHREFIAYATNSTVTFWDTLGHTQLGLIQHPQDILSIALSPDDRLIAIGGEDGEITIKCLSPIIVSIVTCCIMVYLNNLPASMIFPHRIQSLCLDSTPLSRNQTFRSRTLFSICGSTINSRTRKHY
jgi:WD40 repeat protein